MRSIRVVVAIAPVLFGACKKKSGDEANPGSAQVAGGSATAAGSGSATAAGSSAAGSSGGSAADSGSAAGSGSAAPDYKALGTYVEGFSTPESVLYDADADLYLVANINGGPADVDDNGFISKVSPDGKSVLAKWIDGAAADVTLDAPKGMAIAGGTLWVADVTHVRLFDAKTGKPTGDIAIDGVTFLNDITPDGKDGVYVTDSGFDAKFGDSGTDAIYHIGKDHKPTVLVKGKDLGKPNGIVAGADGSVWVVTFGTGELYQVNAKGEKQAGEKLPKGQLDGVVALDGGELLISSWEGEAVYRGKPGGPWTVQVPGVAGPADIGWDPKRKAVLVPLFSGNATVFVGVK